MADRSAWKIVEDLFKDHAGHIIAMGKVIYYARTSEGPASAEMLRSQRASHISREEQMFAVLAGPGVQSWSGSAC